MRIFIVDKNKFEGADLKVGKFYNVEIADMGTAQQRKTIYALMDCYYYSNCHSYNCTDINKFYEIMKRDLGAGDDPRRSLIDPITGASLDEPVIVHGLKSIRDYNKKERMDFISNLIDQMNLTGVDTPKYREILQGLERNSMGVAV